ncbi:UvrD-helicase domain-containing protein [Synechococcus sp. CBW1002]|uniref:UvrD-helicase domain-containing protein n=2 Tax=Synechococcus TaxID=1129 RepID=UPI0018CD0890|nr:MULTISPECIES: UvrD-helicase domain-containing protein [unclassified Synechococcus]QPN58817.1 UvrD-helicase domain-containing protein [Synechococcus sp. CBW1002]QPN65556.1 UvrD-helicase domain-containing protein [Synechococcus sp. CBW1006]
MSKATAIEGVDLEGAALDFDANTVPLTPGVQLLEASAGTGKTFALAHLVLRLVTREEEPLSLEQLLVVTFTEAAAAELRDRIARRLQEALTLLETPAAATTQPPDQVLADWLALQPPDPEVRDRLRGRLLLALEELDRADITTIHGFCRRTLQRRALEAGLGPAVELENDDGERSRQVCHDYWQQQVLGLAPELLAGLQSRGLGLQRLQKLLGQLDGDPALELDALPAAMAADQPLAPQLTALWPQLWERFVKEWREHGAALEQSFRRLPADWKALGIQTKTTPYAAKPKTDRAAQVDHWIASLETTPSYAMVLELREGGTTARSPKALLRDYFHPAPWVKLTAPMEGEGKTLPEAPLMEAIAALVDGPAELTLLHFGHWGRLELRRRRRQNGQMGFGDLLLGLDPGPQGDRHAALIAAVRQRYRVALVDEFQDTDPIQWRILESAFTTGGHHLLVMVGDPKQAIYRFRGGELATYRLARHRADAVHALRENRRSAEPLVKGLNALMHIGLERSELPAPKVLSRATKGELVLPAGERPLQLLACAQEAELPEAMAGLCLQLLERDLRLRTAAADEGPAPTRPLQPQDLCLLVRTHSQAETLRRALDERGLPSRLVSRGDVFASEGATTLQRLLDALADPASDGRRRLLAASPLLGWSATELATATPEAWAELAERLGRLAQLLPRQGLMGVLSQLLSTTGLARLSLGGRLLADLQQAAELVQERMHQQALPAAAAADWLRRLRLDPDREVPEAHQLHSDAADSAVAVVTVHRSKGLEYPVVLCPYLWHAPPAPTSSPRELGRRWRPPGSAAPRLDLHLSPYWGPGRQAALADRQAQVQERERLAYVALTRAQHLLVLGWLDPLPAKHTDNPLTPWLQDASGQPRNEDDLPLQRLDPAQLPPPGRRWQRPAPEGALEGGPLPRHRIDTSWGRSSYSSWTHGAASLAPEAREQGRDTDGLVGETEVLGSAEGVSGQTPAQSARTKDQDSKPLTASERSLPNATVVGQPWSRHGPLAEFPRGAGPGDTLHRILERLDYRQPTDTPASVAVVQQELERAGLAPELQPNLLAGLEQLRQTPLGGELGSFGLADLPLAERLNEMSFDLPLAIEPPDGLELPRDGFEKPYRRPPQVTAAGLAEVFAAHPGGLVDAGYARSLGGLEVASRGFLTGSIDLVFCQGERWWVLDWKSNWIGERDAEGRPLACGPAHYDRQAMAAQMVERHYLLQAHLYLVALHRYLRWRLPGYRPQRHLGGWVYAFLRGAPGPCQAEQVPGMVVERPPLQRLLALDALLQRGDRETGVRESDVRNTTA